MLARRSVLVVDSLEETPEVLRTALAPRGVDVISAHGSTQAWALARRHRPELIVLDLECDSRSPSLAERLADSQPDSSLVLLGKARGVERPGCSVVRKPYHYTALLRKIEEFLAGDREPQPCLRCSSSAEITRVFASS